ncbi:MAG: oligosaccharide flippase family protein, partial [Nitrospirales bacterium]
MKSTQETMRGIATNWVALALSFVVTFFLSPFVVHHLGNTAYGVWTLVVSVTSYMRLLDLGLRGAVTRFVARDQAKGNHEGASQMVSAALWLRQWIGLLILVLSIILAAGINHFFNVPHEMRTAASQAIIVSGLTVVATLLSGVFAGVLAAMHRFDAISGVSVLQIIMRALGVVWLLRSGHGILALAVLELVIAVVPNLLLVWNCFRIYPELRVSLRFPRQNALREIWTHTSYIIVIHICGQIIYYTDNIVVGSCISVAAVTLFAIGGSIAEYLRQILGSITPTFMPLASRFDATGDRDQLRRLLIQGTRLALLAVLPVQMALLIRGRSFIGLWMGQQYGQVSGVVLQILLVGQIFAAANSTGHNIVLGLGKFGKAAKWGIAEA